MRCRPAVAWLAAGLVVVLAPVPAERAVAQSGGESYSIWPTSTTPSVVADPDAGAVELGVKFGADVNGVVTGIRFHKSSTNTGTHVANLWTSTGTKLATATFQNETPSGWQQVNLSAPVAITAGAVYVVSYHTNTGHYSVDESYFLGQGADNPPLHALANGVSGANGVYAYGASTFPTNSWHGSNYWVDVVFSPTGSADTSPPTITAFTVPGTTTTLSVAITSFTATDDVGVTGYLVNQSPSKPSAAAA
ncbi:MAG: DUF4082 domain-containing protein, partial [Luteitalea sp.]|nr:DUF4082 domain-containing protein [Luteitalea sp.]